MMMIVADLAPKTGGSLKLAPISMTPAPDGTLLANYVWPASPSVPSPINAGGIASVYLLHGLNDHAGRYDPLARWLNARGWRVAAHDHRGHGQSEGRRATLSQQEDLVYDAVSRLQAWTQAQGRAPILLGHSMGALVALRIALRQLTPLDGLVLSSPPLMLDMPASLRRILTWLSQWAPNLRLPYGFGPSYLSHDRTVVKAYHCDPLIRRRISSRLARFIDEGGRASLREAARLTCHTLLMVAGDDRIVDAEGSRLFAQQAPAELLTLRWYDHAWHEIFNEVAAISTPVYHDLNAWLEQRARALSAATSTLPEPGAQTSHSP
jgi:alpha-beta hydrolase superfamily lysophospholipase